MRDIRISLVERGEYVLPHLDPRQSRRAANHLRSMGVDVLTSTAVSSIAPQAVHAIHEDVGRDIRSDITLWAAGVEAPKLCATLGLTVNRANQIVVDGSLRTPEDSNVYAFGDCASYNCPVKGVVPPRAQVAHQQAMFLADLLSRQSGRGENKGRPVFQYHDYGSLVSLGPTAAVGALTSRGIPVGGFTARTLYALMYQKHMLALHGMLRMAMQSVSDWLRARLAPPVRLH
jgi:NADH dehydrogenase